MADNKKKFEREGCAGGFRNGAAKVNIREKLLECGVKLPEENER